MKLLLVEDDMKIATAIKRGLEADGFNVEEMRSPVWPPR
jgi:DNA-binding response OmpR family regulator